eukprot:1157445-Pelagomonas_calceolata.AAC.12
MRAHACTHTHTQVAFQYSVAVPVPSSTGSEAASANGAAQSTANGAAQSTAEPAADTVKATATVGCMLQRRVRVSTYRVSHVQLLPAASLVADVQTCAGAFRAGGLAWHFPIIAARKSAGPHTVAVWLPDECWRHWQFVGSHAQLQQQSCAGSDAAQAHAGVRPAGPPEARLLLLQPDWLVELWRVPVIGAGAVTSAHGRPRARLRPLDWLMELELYYF